METLKKPLILIVDDMPKNIQVLSNILHNKGYNIRIATNGSQALESVKTKAPDLILLDIQMPEMDGFEVCIKLKENSETKEIPIIFLTAMIEPEKIVQGFELGAVDYITKPFNVAELSVRVATQIEIKQSREKLLELNATKDKFFSIIAHDLRNPFAGIMGLSEIMETKLTEDIKVDLAQLLKYSQLILSSSKSAFDLLNNLMEWSRSQTGNISVNPTNIPMDLIFSTAFLIVSGNALKKNITIEKGFTDNDMVYVDNLLTNTILRNLLTNAIKFTHPNGKITVSTQKNEGFIEISVTDTGVGIEPKNLDKIFKIDSKFSNTGTENEKGTGLGLILCKEFVEKQGGTIWVKSELGIGSTFTFTLPLGREKVQIEDDVA
jgi:signal transduction histidine kinase